jgi:hypothetical protein
MEVRLVAARRRRQVEQEALKHPATPVIPAVARAAPVH